MKETFRELTWQQFKQRLIKSGWSEEEAEAEIKRLQEEEPESEFA